MKKNVVIGFLGSSKDSGGGQNRFRKWRPTISLFQHDDLPISKIILFFDKKFEDVLKTVSKDIRDLSPETEVMPYELSYKDPWDLEEVYTGLFDFCSSQKFAPDKENYLIHMTTGTHVAQICLYLLVESKFLPGRMLQASPPQQSTRSPAGYSIVDLNLARYDRVLERFQKRKIEGVSFLKTGIETKNIKFNSLIEEIEKVAIGSKAPILLMGPTGAGKSRLASQIFKLKKRRNQVEGQFVEVNCATLRGDGAMSALFGHVKGAFTGALKDREGFLKLAHGGVLFLDEIGELGVDEQAMLLRAIEDKRFTPFGGDKEVTSDFQLIAGTNRDLYQDHNFRDDLLARINLWTYQLPGLKDRPEDIEPNLNFELEKFSADNKMNIQFNSQAKKKFLEFAQAPSSLWHGNFRDLGGVVQRLATLSGGARIDEALVDKEIERLRQQWGRQTSQRYPRVEKALGNKSELDLFDLAQLEEVLRVCQESSSLSEAGRKLFSNSRARKKSANDADRLKKYLAKFDLQWPIGV